MAEEMKIARRNRRRNVSRMTSLSAFADDTVVASTARRWARSCMSVHTHT